jgi:hypothetical protein
MVSPILPDALARRQWARVTGFPEGEERFGAPLSECRLFSPAMICFLVTTGSISWNGRLGRAPEKEIF